MGLFNDRTKIDSKTGVPIWFMRQAGRYHDHYQNLKKSYTFMQLCKRPDLAEEVTHGPINSFGFDAAILFSDLLFPLEYLGMGLEYSPGPKLSFKLDESSLSKLIPTQTARDFFDFQKQACLKLRKSLDPSVTLLGFAGAPFTLYTYAVHGSHAGNLNEAKVGLYTGLFQKFLEKLYPCLLEELLVQAEGGADALCLFDTAVGECTVKDFKQFLVPVLRQLAKDFKARHPDKKIIYYSRNTHVEHLREIQCDDIDVLGVDWRHSLPNCLKQFGRDYYVQGNIDPTWLHLPWKDLKSNLDSFREEIYKENLPLEKWIGGLGHGVTIQTPEENVKKTVEYFHRHMLY